MANAARDENRVTVLMGASSADGSTLVPVEADPTAHYMQVDDNTTGSDLSGDIDLRDANFVPVAIAASSADGVTPVILYVNADGELLVDST